MESPAQDARRLVARLRGLGGERADAIPSLPEAPRLQFLPELKYLNERWVLPSGLDRPDGSGIAASVKFALKRVTSKIVLAALGRYLLEEREFLANLVRMQNELVKRAEQLSEETRLLAQALRAEAGELRERDELLHRLLEARIERLERS